jgi:CRP-like cAMP-binding protein
MTLQHESPHIFRRSILLDELVDEISTSDLDVLTAIGTRRTYAAGTDVFRSGERPGAIYIHREGDVALVKDTGAANANLMYDVPKQCVYGLSEVLADTNFESGLRTTVNTRFDVIDRVDLINFLRRSPEACFGLARIFSRRYHEAVGTLKGQ